MKQIEFIWIPNPSFMIGNYKVIINDSISFELCDTLKKLLRTLGDLHSDDNIILERFVSHLAVDLLLPLQVCPVPNAYVD